jgi:hypothetical protein
MSLQDIASVEASPNLLKKINRSNRRSMGLPRFFSEKSRNYYRISIPTTGESSPGSPKVMTPKTPKSPPGTPNRNREKEQAKKNSRTFRKRPQSTEKTEI